jgi:predicted extracellular nuclease
LGLVAFGCSSSSGTPATPTPDAGEGIDASVAMDASTGNDASVTGSTTIAGARAGNVKTPITVTAVVIAVRGDDPMDTKEWYIEDPAGGPNSGIAVYCDHAATTSPCSMSVTAPALHDLVTVTGTITSYKGKLEIAPTAQTVVMSGAALPPIATVTPADLAASGMSNLRGTLVKLATKVTVDNVTPQSLYYTKCSMSDGGAGPDGGATLCTGCAPPTYGGFQVNDGSSHELLVENHFYTSEHLQGSPECLTQMGAIPVMNGTTFSSITGVLDFNPTSMVQTLSPVVDADYTTP